MGGKSKGSSKVEINDYYMSMHLGVCLGKVDALLAIIIGEKVAWTGEVTTSSSFSISKPDLFGGIKKEGGVVGTCYFMPGSPASESPTAPTDLATRLGRTPATCPAFSGLCNLFLYDGGSSGGFLWGSNSPYIRSVWAKVRRRPSTFGAKAGEPSNYANMGSEANPAHMIYECLTNTAWGMGASTDIINTVSFQDAAKTLYQEGFGLSMIWTQQATIESFIQEIIDHILATLYVNPQTGLLEIKLIRDDYDIDLLPELNPDNCKITKFERKIWGETINEINVTWTNPENEQEETVTMHDLANIEMQGGIVSDTRNYYGIRSRDLASKVAARDIRTAAAPLASFDIEVNRTVRGLLPGGVVKLVYPELGIDGLVLRLNTVDYGRPGESMVKITSIEDIFGLPQSAYTVPSDTNWESEAQEPTDLDYSLIMTIPAYFSAQVASQLSLGTLEYPEVLAGLLGATNNRDTRSYELYGELVQPNGSLAFQGLGTKPLISRTTLNKAIKAEGQTILTGDEIGMPELTSGLLPVESGFVVIGDTDESEIEIALISTMSSDYESFTLERGVLDTVPRRWPVGTPIWFLDAGLAWGDGTIFSEGSVAKFKTLPSTSLGQLPIGGAAERTQTLTDRPYCPLRPGDVKINGNSWGPVFQTSTADFTVTWARRNRLTEDTQVVLWGDGDVSPEAGQTTKIVVMDMDRTVLTTHSGITGTSFTLPYASLDGERVAIVRVTSERDGFESIQGHEILISNGTGYGTNYGNNYGSIS